MIARTATVDATPPNTIRALPGSFRLDGMDANLRPPVPAGLPVVLQVGAGAFLLSGEDMTPQAGYAMPVGTGAFLLVDPGTTQMSPPALTLSLDGQVAGANSSTNTLVLPALVTTKSNNVIVVLTGVNSANPTSVVGSTLGAFTQHGSGGSVQLWWKLQGVTPLAGEVITATMPAGTYATGRAFAVNGAKTSAPFDTNASVPNLTGFGAPQDPATITTTAANTMVIGAWRMSAASSPNAGPGFTQIPTVSPGDYYLYEYQIFSTNGLKTVTVGAPDVGGTMQGFIDAIVAGP
jgi:hypothetical protein